MDNIDNVNKAINDAMAECPPSDDLKILVDGITDELVMVSDRIHSILVGYTVGDKLYIRAVGSVFECAGITQALCQWADQSMDGAMTPDED